MTPWLSCRPQDFFAIDLEEIRSKAQPGCPDALIALAQQCVADMGADRPTMERVRQTLGEICDDLGAEMAESAEDSEDEYVAVDEKLSPHVAREQL